MRKSRMDKDFSICLHLTRSTYAQLDIGTKEKKNYPHSSVDGSEHSQSREKYGKRNVTVNANDLVLCDSI